MTEASRGTGAGERRSVEGGGTGPADPNGPTESTGPGPAAGWTVPIPGDVAPDVVRRARAGDDRAFAQLVEHYDPALRRLAHLLLHDRALTDRALSDAYVKAYRALPRFRRTTSPGVWLYRIVYGTCVDELRRRFHQPMRPGGAPTASAAAEPVSAIEQALDVLPADLRALIVMVDGDEFRLDGAAEVLGLDPRAVPTRLARARLAVRQALIQQELTHRREGVAANGGTAGPEPERAGHHGELNGTGRDPADGGPAVDAAAEVGARDGTNGHRDTNGVDTAPATDRDAVVGSVPHPARTS